MRPLSIDTEGLHEEIVAYSYIKGEIVQARTAIGRNIDGQFVADNQFPLQEFDIQGQELDLLLSENNETGKPAGVFRPDDLWAFIDANRSRGGLKTFESLKTEEQLPDDD